MQTQTNEIQATADSEPELELPCSEPTAAADMPTAAAARTDGQCIPHSGHCNRVGSLHARNARLFG